jgi:hypothetical protein
VLTDPRALLRTTVETAFAVERTASEQKRIVMAFDLRDRSVVDEQRLNLYEKIVAKTLDDPSSLESLYGLYGGSSFPPDSTPSLKIECQAVSTADSPNLDISRIESIASVNVSVY